MTFDVELEENEVIVFDIFFAGIVSMAHCHPANGRSNGYAEAPPQKSVEECAKIALEMIRVRRNVLYGPAQEALLRDAWLESVSQAEISEDAKQ